MIGKYIPKTKFGLFGFLTSELCKEGIIALQLYGFLYGADSLINNAFGTRREDL